MTTRTRYTGSSTEVPWDDAGASEGFGNQYARLLGVLLDHSALVLTAVGGTGDAVTASLDPELDGAGLVDGMKFTLTWGAANSGAVTLAINGGAALPVLDAEGVALAPGRLETGLRSLIEHAGGSFRVLSALAGGLSVPKYHWVITASGTWTKPADLAPDAMVIVEGWAGGGSGARSGTASANGGGGAGYARKVFRAGDLPASVAVSIGAGGAARTTNGNGNAGGTTTFGALLTAHPGGGGGTGPGGGGGGGGGGGEHGPGGTANNAGGPIGGGPLNTGGQSGVSGNALTIYGGGAGTLTFSGGSGEDAWTVTRPAGHAVHGAAGGGRSTSDATLRPGGKSIHGGDGGAGSSASGTPGSAGSAPGGGGASGWNADSGAGARGEVRIWIP